ncbi:unnamed protein product [Staurois parvus]|uniref:Uncharacterized protein n=1 Tax=Staurois parvus TaxID=386267 RepID=A0ABN9AT68_9NEOB|nr:unnamed protein product [Staurois parvus]
MHPSKKIKLSSNTHQTEHVQLAPKALFYQEMSRGQWKKGRIREDRIKQPFYTVRRINPLGTTVSITSMLYCQGRTDHLKTRALP